METQERQYFILRGKLQRQRLESDVERIIAVYNDNGFIQARVESTDFSIDRETALVTITIVVVEGPQFRVGEVNVKGVTLVPEIEVVRQIRVKPGDVFSRTRVRDSVQGILNLYSTIGRASADINPRRDQPHHCQRDQRDLRDHGRPRGLRRADQHRRQRAEPGPDPAPRDPAGRRATSTRCRSWSALGSGSSTWATSRA